MRLLTQQANPHAALDGIAAMTRPRDCTMYFTNGAGGKCLVTITGGVAFPAVEDIDPNRFFVMPRREMQRRAAVVAAMTETACLHE